MATSTNIPNCYTVGSITNPHIGVNIICNCDKDPSRRGQVAGKSIHWSAAAFKPYQNSIFPSSSHIKGIVGIDEKVVRGRSKLTAIGKSSRV